MSKFPVPAANEGRIDLTQHEIAALRMEFNLADAHTHQNQSATQHRIVQRLPSLWYESERELQATMEQRFVTSFFTFHRQPTALRMDRTMLSYAASISTLVAAMYCKQRDLSVALIEPCFDNLRDVLLNAGVRVAPLAENALATPDNVYQRLSDEVESDALFLVDPNNPTGFSMLKDGRSTFEEVVRFCQDHDKLLLLDFCFASFTVFDERVPRFDVYELLEASGISYIALEDTGKTWPVQDAKCALLTASADIHRDVYDIHTSVLLNVSPFVLNMLSHYVEDSIADDLRGVRDILETNRQSVMRTLKGTTLEYQPPVVDVSVAWARITDPDLSATALQAHLEASEVYVLPGTYFYWHNRRVGEGYIRIALARRPEQFAQAMERLKHALANLPVAA